MPLSMFVASDIPPLFRFMENLYADPYRIKISADMDYLETRIEELKLKP